MSTDYLFYSYMSETVEKFHENRKLFLVPSSKPPSLAIAVWFISRAGRVMDCFRCGKTITNSFTRA